MATSLKSRFLLCRPRGGLNDTLCQIENCWKYAERFNRHLIIDTQKSALWGHFDDFFEILNRSSEVSSRLSPELLSHINALPIRPQHLTGRLGDYSSHYESEVGYVETLSGIPTRFGSNRSETWVNDFDEPVLVHEDWGGGNSSIDLLRRIRIVKDIQPIIHQAIASLQTPYSAVHIRNTDYRTNYPKLLKKIKRNIKGGRLLVCSDDPTVVEHAKCILPGQVLSFDGRAKSEDPSGVLHRITSYQNDSLRRQAVINSLVDLLSLGNAQHLYLATLDSLVDVEKFNMDGQITHLSIHRQTLSGYSKLARHVCESNDIVDHLLGNSLETQIKTSERKVTIIILEPLLKRIYERVKQIIKEYV